MKTRKQKQNGISYLSHKLIIFAGAKHKKCVESNKRSQDPAIQAKLKAAAELTAAAEVRKANPETATTDKKDDFEARSQVWPLIDLLVDYTNF